MQESELLDVQAVAARLNVNPRTVLRMVGREELTAIRVARRLRFRPGDLETYLQTHLSTSYSPEQPEPVQLLPAEMQEHAAEGLREQQQGLSTGIQGLGGRHSKEFIQLELEKQRLELEQKKLELQKQLLELHTRRIDYALDTADRLVNMLPPEADAGTKAALLQTLLPGLLPPGQGHSLESALLALKTNTEHREGTSGSNRLG
jgi:excisionase family DNA binding protein